MTNERAIEYIRGIKNYLTTGNPVWSKDAIAEACGMAIKALEEPEIIRCKDCKYAELDEDGWWYCGDLGCQMGNEDGEGFCSDAKRR